tara:strand:+ start:332 stop:541 length:210 start_codon:yes stop_codon:yes gene_type:complete
MRAAKFAIYVKKCRTDIICAKRSEIKVKQSNLVYILENSRETRKFVILMLKMVKNCEKHMCMAVFLRKK